MKPVGSWDLEGQSIEGSLGLESLYFKPCTPTYLLVDQFGLEGREEIFRLSNMVFLFDNTSRCYLVFVFLFPLLLVFYT